MKPAQTRALLGRSPEAPLEESPVYAAVTDAYRRCPSPDPVQKAEYADLKVYLPNDPLVKVDRMSMAHSLEVRCPLLDRRVVELAFRIPAWRKQVGGKGKTLLRKLAKRRLPAGIWQLPKRGFTVPIGGWIGGPYAGTFQNQVLGHGSSISSHIDLHRVHGWLASRADFTGARSYALWALWCLERWLRSCAPPPESLSTKGGRAFHQLASADSSPSGF